MGMVKMCLTCPFALTEASEQVQNYGCLPTPQDIRIMTQQTGKSWECHSVKGTPCKGAQENKIIGNQELITYEVWYRGDPL